MRGIPDSAFNAAGNQAEYDRLENPEKHEKLAKMRQRLDDIRAQVDRQSPAQRENLTGRFKVE
jgi:hypothetical protein